MSAADWATARMNEGRKDQCPGLRLVSWNVCDGFTRKFGHLERLKPDIAILQEVRPECLAYAALGASSLWTGDVGQKGLAVVAYNGWRLEPAPVQVQERWFLPAVARRGDEAVHLVAVWVDSSAECAPPTLRALETLKPFIEAESTIIAGDFNQTVTLDRRKGKGRRFSEVLAVLERLGLISAWHFHAGEAHGKESEPSLYWTWNREKPFHIDYAFSSQILGIDEARLGGFDQYVAAGVSDHVPLVVDYSF